MINFYNKWNAYLLGQGGVSRVGVIAPLAALLSTLP